MLTEFVKGVQKIFVVFYELFCKLKLQMKSACLAFKGVLVSEIFRFQTTLHSFSWHFYTSFFLLSSEMFPVNLSSKHCSSHLG